MPLAVPVMLSTIVSATLFAALAEVKLADCAKVTLAVSVEARPTNDPPVTDALVVPS